MERKPIEEPELTRVIRDIELHGMDVVSLLESTPDGVYWREQYGGLTVDPIPKSPYEREMTARDLEVLDNGFCGNYDYIQIVFSSMVPRNDTYERAMSKTAHLPLESIKQYLRRRYGRGD